MRNILYTLCVFWYQLPFGILESDSGDREKVSAAAEKFTDRYQKEIDAGSMADIFVSNRHTAVPSMYKEFGRRFVLQYPYTEKSQEEIDADAEKRLDDAAKAALKKAAKDQDKLTPVKAPPEVVLAVAKQSLLKERARPKNNDYERLQSEILRSGDYWNGVWKEDVPEPVRSPLRSSNSLDSVPVKIMPGSTLYKLVKMTKDLSTRLLYVINE